MQQGKVTPKMVLALVLWSTLLVVGYQARRPVWTRRSWGRFGLLLGTATSMIAISLGMAYGVDHGVYNSLSQAMGQLYFYAMMVLAAVGTLSGTGLLMWFASGRPDRQLG